MLGGWCIVALVLLALGKASQGAGLHSPITSVARLKRVNGHYKNFSGPYPADDGINLLSAKMSGLRLRPSTEKLSETLLCNELLRAIKGYDLAKVKILVAKVNPACNNRQAMILPFGKVGFTLLNQISALAIIRFLVENAGLVPVFPSEWSSMVESLGALNRPDLLIAYICKYIVLPLDEAVKLKAIANADPFVENLLHSDAYKTLYINLRLLESVQGVLERSRKIKIVKPIFRLVEPVSTMASGLEELLDLNRIETVKLVHLEAILSVAAKSIIYKNLEALRWLSFTEGIKNAASLSTNLCIIKMNQETHRKWKATLSPGAEKRSSPYPPTFRREPVRGPLPKQLRLRDFELLAKLGSGAWGTVFVAEHLASKQLFAVKRFDRSSIVERAGRILAVDREVDVLSSIEHNPFVVKFYGAFQDVNSLYLVLEYLPGGSLGSLLRNIRLFHGQSAITIAILRFYLAQVVLGVKDLHRQNIIHRDVKVDNVALDEYGNARLIDFGLSKRLGQGRDKMANAATENGTLTGFKPYNYHPPELINGQVPVEGYGISVDWYMVGCLLYEMVTGQAPFHNYSTNPEVLVKKISYEQPPLPNYYGNDTISMIRSLMDKDPKKRIGYEEIRSHKWFSGFKWDDLESGRMEVPVKVPPNKIKRPSAKESVTYPTYIHADDGVGPVNNPFKHYGPVCV